MANNPPTSHTLKALPIQLAEIASGVILKRGRIEIKVSGMGAAKVVHNIFDALAHDDYTQEELCERFAGPEREEVNNLIEKLIAGHMLVKREALGHPMEPRESHLEIFYRQFGKEFAEVNKRLNEQCFTILGVNYISRQLIDIFERSGIENFQVVDYPLLRNLRLFDSGAGLTIGQWPMSRPPLEYRKWKEGFDTKVPSCLIATSDFGGQQTMRNWNQFCIERKQRFLPVVLQDMIGYIGPLVTPGETACYECFCLRQNSHLSNIEDHNVIDQMSFEGQIVNGFHPAMASVLSDLATIELAKFYSGALPLSKAGTIIEVNLLATQLTARTVLKIPRCSICSPLRRHSASKILINAPGLGAL